MTKRQSETFESWMARVDAVLEELVEVTSDDLPDVDYYPWYEDSVSPASAAHRALAFAGYYS
jgi:hypothetical protein